MLDPDKIIKNFIEIIEKGKLSYKLSTIIPDFLIDSTFHITENNNFLLSFTLQPDELKKGLDLNYFLQRPFALASTGITFFINNYEIIGGSQGIVENEPCKFKIEIKSFRGDNEPSLWQESKQTAFIKFNEKKFNPWSSGVSFNLTTDSKDNGFYNAVLLKVSGVELIFYHKRISFEESYFIFNPKQKVDFNKFERIVNSIITAFGFLSGYYMLDTIYYFTKKEVKGKRRISCFYENHQRSINSSNPIVDGRHYEDISKDEMQLSSNQFNNLVNLLYNDDEYLRSAQLLIESGLVKGSAKASLGAVALETITKKIDADLVKGQVINDKKVINGLKDKLKKVLKEYYSCLSKEQMQILSNRLNQINNKPNSNKLFGSFEYLGISLNKEEIDCINSRNLFLHGNLPKNKVDSWLKDDELLNIMAHRLVMLSSMLILKLSEYSGYVIDRGMTEVLKWRMIMNGQKAPNGNCLRNINDKNIN
jgi:hypothetical protein